MIQNIFDVCVIVLRWLAALFDTTYEAMNVWIFCILWPAFTALLVIIVTKQRMTIRRLRKFNTDPLP